MALSGNSGTLAQASVALLDAQRYGSSAVRVSRHALAQAYYLCALALVVSGFVLWATGYGTGRPFLDLGVVLGLTPGIVIWLRQRRHRR